MKYQMLFALTNNEKVIGVGRLRILGGQRLRILGGPRGAKFPAGT